MIFHEMKDFIVEKTRRNIEVIQGGFPCVTYDGIYDLRENGGWVGGFWTGLNWLCFEFTGDRIFADTALKFYDRLKYRLYHEQETLDHDIGFLYIPSAVAEYRLTGNRAAAQDARAAANELAKRYNEKGGFIRAWNVWDPEDPFVALNDGRIILDCMYNLPLLFWSAKTFGDKKAEEMAIAHANTCKKYMIREDNSTMHTFVLNPETGSPMFGQTRQGYSDDSCWSRGHSWTIGGYAIAYKYTNDVSFLETSKRLADYFIDHLEKDLIPMWDFKLPAKEGEERDSSAAAIAASGMLEIGEDYYTQKAKDILVSLYQNYSSKDSAAEQGLLLHACGNKPAGHGNNDASLIFGDYYFAEAVAKVLEVTVNYWI